MFTRAIPNPTRRPCSTMCLEHQKLPAPRPLPAALLLSVASLRAAPTCGARTEWSPTAQEMPQDCGSSAALPCLGLCHLLLWHCTRAARWVKRGLRVAAFAALPCKPPDASLSCTAGRTQTPQQGLAAKTLCRLADIKGRIFILSIRNG